jgi:3-methyladenine DNA glycosylase AlkC
MPLDTTPAPSLKDWFDEARYRSLADQLASLHPRFDRKRFLKLTLGGLGDRSLMQRLRRTSEATREALPLGYRDSLDVLRELAPQIDHGFVTLFLPDFVGLHGHDDFDASMDALKFFTPFGSSEFAIREFLKRDLRRTLRVMHGWSEDANEHVRRLASEGCRPRLPWSFRLVELVADPAPALPILENLKADPSLYVRKSVANHLNDIAKDHPDKTLDVLHSWDRDHPHTAWIAKRALRTLIKEGHAGALTLLGAGEAAKVRVDSFEVTPKRVRLGETVNLCLAITSTARKSQRLLVDYVIHYVKQSGGTSEKVFKWKELELAPGGTVALEKRQTIRDFTTRKHYPGIHRVEVQVNGARLAEGAFGLVVEP